MASRATIKANFQTGDKPTQVQFAEWIDSDFNLTDDTTLSLNTLTIDPLGAFGGNGIEFSDGDTKIHETVDDILAFTIGGSQILNMTEDGINGSGTGTATLYTNVVSNATTPVHVFDGDTTTGVGRAAADQLSLITGGVEGLRVDGRKVIVDPSPTYGDTTGYWFGDGDTGFYETSDDVIYLSVAGAPRIQLTTAGIGAVSSTGGILSSFGATSTFPTLQPRRSDNNTGMGWAGTDQLSIIAGASEGIRVATTQVSLQSPNSASTPHKNGSISFDLDESGNNLMVRVLYSDSTSKTATIALT